MPIEGKSLPEAGQRFCDDLNHLLATTISQRRLVLLSVGERINIAFREKGHGAPAKLRTRFGEMELYIGLLCGATRRDRRRFRLFISEYRYSLTPEGSKEPLWRWEYVRDWPTGGLWCRHHLQGNIPMHVGRTRISLNDLHLPTGYVTIEEILRFCIVDLRVRPLSRDWHEAIANSYKQLTAEREP